MQVKTYLNHFKPFFMEVKQIESLLLQEMEDVKGGLTYGSCTCESGAGQSVNDPGGKCVCSKGGAAQIDTGIAECICDTSGARQK